MNARSFVPRKRLWVNDERGRASRSTLVSAFLGPRATTPSSSPCSYVFARSAFRPSSPPASSSLSLSLSLSSPTGCPPRGVILVVPLSAGARAKAGPRQRGGEKREAEREIEGDPRRHLQFAGEKDGQRTGLARPTRTRRGGNPVPKGKRMGRTDGEGGGRQRRCQRDDETKQRENGSRTRYGSQELSPVSSEITGSRPRAHVSIPPPRRAAPLRPAPLRPAYLI